MFHLSLQIIIITKIIALVAETYGAWEIILLFLADISARATLICRPNLACTCYDRLMLQLVSDHQEVHLALQVYVMFFFSFIVLHFVFLCL